MSDLNYLQIIPFASFVILLVLQSLWPRRTLTNSGSTRILHNLLLFVVNTLLMRVAVPLTLVGASAWASQHDTGLFNVLTMPSWAVVLLCVVALDFAIYWQHVATHKFAVLWRLHKVHHADHEMDVSTAIRFHPIELLLSLAFKSVAVILLGAPILAVLIFELLLFVGPAFNHSNLSLPAWLDKRLRYVIATPDTHRAHHSTLMSEQNTNYGFFLIWWDKLFGTYTDVPSGGHENMAIGLDSPEQKFERVDQMLVAPFR